MKKEGKKVRKMKDIPMADLYYPWNDEMTLDEYLRAMKIEHTALRERIDHLTEECNELHYTCQQLIQQLIQVTGYDYYIRISPVRETKYSRTPLEALTDETMIRLDMYSKGWDDDELAALSEATTGELADFIESTFGEDTINEIGIQTIAEDEAVKQKAYDIMLDIALTGNIADRYGFTFKRVKYNDFYEV